MRNLTTNIVFTFVLFLAFNLASVFSQAHYNMDDLQQQDKLDKMPNTWLDAYSEGDLYLKKELQDIQNDIGNSAWWDNFSEEAQIEVIEGIEHLPADFSADDLKDVMAITWKELLGKKTTISQTESVVPCPVVGDVYLANQDEVDAFGALGCNEIDGHLFIDDSGNTPKIIDLGPLNALQTISGIMEIRTSQLQTLDGLSNISSVGYLRLLDNHALKDLNGLSGLQTCTGPILEPCSCSSFLSRIDNNDLLVDLSGLENLESAVSGLFINANASLENINGLNNLSYVGGALAIENHPVLKNVHDLSSLTEVGRDLVFRANPNLKNLSGLSNLATVGAWVVIDNNASLKNLAGLSGLTTINGYLAIWSNANLKNLGGMASLNSLGGVQIFHNPSIKNVSALSFLTSPSGDVIVWNNATLDNIDGLANLTTVGGWMVLQELPALENMDALSNITWVGGIAGIATCPLFTNVDGFSNLTYAGAGGGAFDMASLENLDGFSNVTYMGGDLLVFLNPVLTSCCGIYQLLCADPGCTTDAVDGNLVIFANGSGCTVPEIIAGGPCVESEGINPPPNTNFTIQSNNEPVSRVQIYPNPVKEELVIDLNQFETGSAELKITNQFGQVIWNEQIPEVGEVFKRVLSLNTIPSMKTGMYFVSITHNDTMYTTPIIVQ